MSRVIAIDGPAGAGKSTVSRRLAQALGFRYVDTGAMYRVVGVLAQRRGVAFDDAGGLGRLCDDLDLRFEEHGDGVRVVSHGEDLSEAIRSPQAGQLASQVSTVGRVRDRLVAKQREMGRPGSVVMEGRDIGTVVFPDAILKVFLDASAYERARRRCRDLAGRGIDADVDQVAAEIAERDARDCNRAHSPLRPATDAVRLDTTEMGIDRVVAALIDHARRALA